MQQILEAEKTVECVCGRQRRKPGIKYRLSCHCLFVPCLEGTLLYHVLTGAMYLLAPGETAEQFLNELLPGWFFVPDVYKEKKQTDDIRRIMIMMPREKKIKRGFTVVTTTDCNARCFYCYENDMPKLTMASSTAKDVAGYIASACGGKSVKLKWFGGEPMLNHSAIDTICAGLRQKNIDYESTMTSNGFYLEGAMCRKAYADWHLRGAQITLDGTEKVYNRIKAYINYNENAFWRLLGNIDAALNNGIRITVRLNLFHKNAEDLLRLLDILEERFSGREGFCIHTVGLKNADGHGYLWDDEEEMDRVKKLIQEKVEQIGASPEGGPPRGIIINQCMADNDASEVIYPDGSIGKCENYNASEIIGDIYSETRDHARIQAWKDRYSSEECDTCVLYPVCIRLKKCFWQEKHCTEHMRKQKIQRLKKQVLNEYYSRKNSLPLGIGEMI